MRDLIFIEANTFLQRNGSSTPRVFFPSFSHPSSLVLFQFQFFDAIAAAAAASHSFVIFSACAIRFKITILLANKNQSKKIKSLSPN